MYSLRLFKKNVNRILAEKIAELSAKGDSINWISVKLGVSPPFVVKYLKGRDPYKKKNDEDALP